MSKFDVIDVKGREAAKGSAEEMSIDELVQEIQAAHESLDGRRGKYKKAVNDLRKKLEGLRADINPKEGEYLDQRLDFVDELIDEMGDNYMLGNLLERNPKDVEQGHLEELRAIVDRFNVPGLSLASSRTNFGFSNPSYGLMLNGEHIGDFVLRRDRADNPDGYKDNDYWTAGNIEKVLKDRGISSSFNPRELISMAQQSDVMSSNISVPVGFGEQGVQMLYSQNVYITADGLFSGLLNSQNKSMGIQNLKYTNRIDVVVDDFEGRKWRVIETDIQGDRNVLVCQGNKVVEIRTQ